MVWGVRRQKNTAATEQTGARHGGDAGTCAELHDALHVRVRNALAHAKEEDTGIGAWTHPLLI